ncbi:hypothetical protein BGZ96_008604 [Linnemannia gamsii]|uniref:Uncharacterized protein n=1 Tax=Linnemannia gamsii TaxID=64522 RepID=A0ABQ7KE89_9FUNG|nr:hypothetical protein BGZ96_008604 [Linnemannia gamsii]
MPHANSPEAMNTFEPETVRMSSETCRDQTRVLLQEGITKIDDSAARDFISSTPLESMAILSPDERVSETETSSATKVDLPSSSGKDHQQHAKDGTAPSTPDKIFSSEESPHSLSPDTPVPVILTTGICARRSNPSTTIDKHASKDDQTGQQYRITLETSRDDSVERSLTECPAFDPEPLADFIAEHRSTTVKKFHEIIKHLDIINAEVQWMLSEYLTQQYEQIEDILDSNHKSITQQESDQELLQEQILSFLNAMKKAFAIFSEKDS